MPHIPFGQRVLEHEPPSRSVADLFDELRRGWRRIDREPLLRALIEQLHRKETTDAVTYALDARARGTMDFVNRTLLLWVLADGHVYEGQKKPPDAKAVQRLLQITWELSASKNALRPIQDSPFLALRNMAVQQFSSQEFLLESTVGRNWHIFTALPANHRLRQLIESTSGIPLENAISFVLLLSSASILTHGARLRSTIFQYARNAFNVHTRLRDMLLAHDGGSLRAQIRVEYTQEEIFAPTPFFRYPLIQLSNEVCVVDPACAGKTAENFPTQIVVELGDERHKKALTELYEQYANRRVNEVFPHGAYVGDQLKKLVTGRVCDQFVRIGPTCVLLVEIKSGTLADHKSASLSGDRLFNVLEGILKEGIVQLLSTRASLLDRRLIQAADRTYMLLVTRENYRLPSNKFLRNIMPKLASTIGERLDDDAWDSLFVCCLDEFDELLDLHATGTLSLSHFFSDAATEGEHPLRSKTGLGGRLRSAKRAHVAPHLRAAYDTAATHCGLLLNDMKAAHERADEQAITP